MSSTTEFQTNIDRFSEGALDLEIFSRHDFRSDFQKFKQLASILTDLKVEKPFNKFQLKFCSEDRFTKKLKITSQIFSEIESEVKKGVYSSAIFYGKGAVLEASIDLADIRNNKSHLRTNIIASLKIVAPEPNAIEQMLQIAYSIWSLVNGVYGFICTGPDWNFVMSEGSVTVISTWGKEPTKEEKQREEELYFYQRSQDKHAEYVRKAYWANFLNSGHVRKLGGLNVVQKNAPCYKVESLPNGGVYLQLTESLFQFTDREFASKLKRLDDFLQPAVLPGRPPVSFS